MRRKNKLYFASISILQTGLNSHLYEKCILLWTTLFQLLHVKLWFFEDLIKVLFWPLEIRFIKFNSFCLFFFILIFFFQVCSSTGFPYQNLFLLYYSWVFHKQPVQVSCTQQAYLKLLETEQNVVVRCLFKNGCTPSRKEVL